MYEVKLGKLGRKRNINIGKGRTHEEAWAIIVDMLKNRGITSPFFRTWSTDGGKTETVDYGNHTEYFYIIKK